MTRNKYAIRNQTTSFANEHSHLISCVYRLAMFEYFWVNGFRTINAWTSYRFIGHFIQRAKCRGQAASQNIILLLPMISFLRCCICMNLINITISLGKISFVQWRNRHKNFSWISRKKEHSRRYADMNANTFTPDSTHWWACSQNIANIFEFDLCVHNAKILTETRIQRHKQTKQEKKYIENPFVMGERCNLMINKSNKQIKRIQQSKVITKKEWEWESVLVYVCVWASWGIINVINTCLA